MASHVHRDATGRLVFDHAPQRSTRIAEKLRSNAQRSCDFKGCGRARHVLHRYCVDHHRRYELTGHPDGQNLRRGGWGPYVSEASAFVLEQLTAGHPGIEAASYWCLEQLKAGAAYTRYDNNRRDHVGFLCAMRRCHRHGVEPTELVARFVAAHLSDDREEAVRPLFKSDEHWEHQAMRLFLYARPIGLLPGWTRRPSTTMAPQPEGIWTPRFGLRRYAFQRVNGAIGLLCFKAAAELRRREAQTQRHNPHSERTAQIDASVPFSPSIDQLFNFNTSTIKKD